MASGAASRREISAAVVDEGSGDSDEDLRMSSGQTVGLLTRDVISKQNADLKAQERAKFQSAAAEDLGKNEETVYRDKRGRRLEQLEAFMKAGEVCRSDMHAQRSQATVARCSPP